MAKNDLSNTHTVIRRGNHPIATVNHNAPDHDEQVRRSVDAAHRMNESEGASVPVTTSVEVDGDEQQKGK
jgi:hypothetical protein